MNYYQVFGLCLASERTLGALRRCSQPHAGADISIHWQILPEQPPAHLKRVNARLWVGVGDIWLTIPEVARFRIRQGEHVTVEVMANVNPATVELYLLGPVLGPLLQQRRHIVLHGNALRFQNKTFLLCGHSTFGKSTLTGYCLLTAACQLIADELSVFDQADELQPGYAQLKLWSDTLQVLGIDSKPLEPVPVGVGKFQWPLPTHQFFAEPSRVDAVFVLDVHEGTQVQLQEFCGVQKLKPLQEQIFRGYMAEPGGLAKFQFLRLARLFSNVPVYRLSRPQSVNAEVTLPAMQKQILAILQADIGVAKT